MIKQIYILPNHLNIAMNIPETISFIRDLYDEKEAFIPLHAPTFAGNEKKYLNIQEPNML